MISANLEVIWEVSANASSEYLVSYEELMVRKLSIRDRKTYKKSCSARAINLRGDNNMKIPMVTLAALVAIISFNSSAQSDGCTINEVLAPIIHDGHRI